MLDSNKLLGRLDWNVGSDPRLTARYYYNDNFNIDRFQSTASTINFENNAEVFPNTQHNVMLQWNGTFGQSLASKTTATFKNNPDDRDVEGEPFPHLSIENQGGTIELGSELFSHPNYLEQTVGTFSNQTDLFVGNRTVTVGTHNEFYSIDNRFAAVRLLQRDLGPAVLLHDRRRGPRKHDRRRRRAPALLHSRGRG